MVARIAALEARPDCDKCEKWQVERIAALEAENEDLEKVVAEYVANQDADEERHQRLQKTLRERYETDVNTALKRIAELEAENERLNFIVGCMQSLAAVRGLSTEFTAMLDVAERRWEERT
jgi:DNA repair exonuclease SbcCD ATPase subunit